MKKGTRIRMMATGAVEEVVEVGYFGAGQLIPCEELSAGMVGYITASIKNVADTRVGDTVTDDDHPCGEPLPGYKKVNPMVYCGMYPADGAKYGDLRDALEKLQLNDASLFYEPETSAASGLRIPLRISGTSAPGDHSGAAGAGVQPGSHHHGTQRNLQDPQDRRHLHGSHQSLQYAGSLGDRLYGGAHGEGGDHGDHRVYRPHYAALRGASAAQYQGMEYMEQTRAVLHYHLPPQRESFTISSTP